MRPIRRGWDTSFCSDRHEVHTRGPLHGCTQGMGYGSTSDHRSVELERACAYVRPDGRPPRQLVMQADGRGPGVALRAQRARLCDAWPVASGEQEGAQPVNQSKGGPLGMGWSPTGWDVDPRLTDRRQRAMAAHGMSADARRLHASAWPLRGTKSPCRASELACFSPCST